MKRLYISTLTWAAAITLGVIVAVLHFHGIVMSSQPHAITSNVLVRPEVLTGFIVTAAIQGISYLVIASVMFIGWYRFKFGHVTELLRDWVAVFASVFLAAGIVQFTTIGIIMFTNPTIMYFDIMMRLVSSGWALITCVGLIVSIPALTSALALTKRKK